MSTPTSSLTTTPTTTGESTLADREVDMGDQIDSKEVGAADPAPPVPPPFSIFTRREKWALIVMTAIAGFYSPVSANIYFPAIPLLAEDFGVSISLMNLTVTVYLIFQGISPMLWAPLADTKGRRPVYLICLSILTVTCIALALVPTSKWWLLLIFRCLQASGAASTVALASGVVADIATPEERGGFLGFTTLGVLLGPCIGPVIGGLLAGGLGWRWIFWFLCILSSVCLTLIFLFFPETLRRIVGNGSTPPPKWYGRPLIPLIGPAPHRSRSPPTLAPSKSRTNPFRLFLEPDIMFMLLATGLTYCLFVVVQSTTAVLFQQANPALSDMELGLCFLPMGVGCLVSSVVTGKGLDWEYKRAKAVWDATKRLGGEEGHGDGEGFHVEKVRLRWSFLYTALTIVSCVAYGWALDRRVHLAVPLVVQFVFGWVIVGQMNSFQTLLIDVLPTQGSSTTAINNFVRCLLGAGIISIVNIIIEAIGAGWTYTLLSLIGAVAIPIFTFVVIRFGPRWRARRMNRA